MRRFGLALLTTSALAAAALAALPASAGPKTDRADPASAAAGLLTAHAGEAKVTAAETFTVSSVIEDPDGGRHVRMHRYHAGLPVLGGDLVVHMGRSDGWEGVNQTLAAPLAVSAAPTVTADRAADVAARASSAGDRVVTGSQLVVDALGDTARLAYAVVVTGMHADGTPSELHIVVDAHNGSVLRTWEGVQHAEGVGHGFHTGDVPVGTTATATGYELRDADHGGHYTIDLRGKKNAKRGTPPVSSPTNEFGDGTLADPATIAVDAHYGGAVTWDYYKNTHGRLGPRNDGVSPYSRVHYGRDYVNAFWSDSCFCMTYGDGDLSIGWNPLTSVDVAAHEMTHGVTSHTAGLIYNGESGGINEATSDIFGTLVEFYAGNTTDVGDYLIGEKLRVNGQSLRYMDKPSKDTRSVDCWYDGVGGLDVHYSSGVGNHLFFLLAVGSGQRTVNGVAYDSPTCDGSTVEGIGNDKAGAIWYRALSVYMTSGTDYHDARVATLNAATDLYGAGSPEYNAVNAAWAAVNVA